MAIVAIVALALAVLLVWSPTTPSVYRAGFFLGLATSIAWLVVPGGEMFVSLGHGTLKRALTVPIVMAVIMAPSIVLMEAGITGYRGFVSFMRYVSVVVAAVGIAWLALGFAIPAVLRRQSRK
jgi:arginine exporter protein ArgO